LFKPPAPKIFIEIKFEENKLIRQILLPKIEIIFKNMLYPEHAGALGNISLKRLKRKFSGFPLSPEQYPGVIL
jgi:hypothetical protein